MKFLLALLPMALTACGATSDYKRASEIEADMPRAMGLGTFAPSCIMFCTVTTEFTHGDDTAVLPNASGVIYGNATTERHQKTFQKKPPKKAKPVTPPPEGATP